MIRSLAPRSEAVAGRGGTISAPTTTTSGSRGVRNRPQALFGPPPFFASLAIRSREWLQACRRRGGKPVKVSRKVLSALPAANGLKTILDEQVVGPTVYFDAAGFPGRAVGLEPR